VRQSDYYRIQGYFSQTHSRDVVIATPDQQAAHQAILDPIEAETKKLRASMRKATEEEKGKIQLRLEELDEKMPPPLKAYYAVTNNTKELTPIHLLGRGDYRSKGAKVGMRPLGILLPDVLINTGTPVAVAISAAYVPIGTVVKLRLASETSDTSIDCAPWPAPFRPPPPPVLPPSPSRSPSPTSAPPGRELKRVSSQRTQAQTCEGLVQGGLSLLSLSHADEHPRSENPLLETSRAGQSRRGCDHL